MTAPHPTTSRRGRLFPLAVVAVTAVVIALLLLGQRGSSDDGAAAAGDGTAAGSELPDLTGLERRESGDPLAEGPPDAPVGLIVYSDYQCTFCAAWTTDTLPALREYVADGQLRIEWRDISIFGEPSDRAARAAYAAGLQGGHQEFHDALFADGATRGADGLGQESLVELAAELGLDADRFTEDLTADATRAMTARNAAEAEALGAVSTPSFLLDGRPVVGAQPPEVFTAAIDEALAAADGAR
ncbi:DsbA family protein [Streptomyces lonarensis]|uniref:Thioredoxin domain-containing protein n=1 Tax=Streptomyces lonarensis TaxID=700599 RepID=A0A7X6D0Q1_9ACTN|nr:thioredoxin domain-containing protein [Streptomyces lonarensis]NJQ06078.1 thioredoxin domain-containing protein [Streptomyces lonarensis]